MKDTATPASNMCSMRLPKVVCDNTCTSSTANTAPANADAGRAMLYICAGKPASLPAGLLNSRAATAAPSPAPATTPKR